MTHKILSEIRRLKGESLNTGYLWALNEIEKFIMTKNKSKYKRRKVVNKKILNRNKNVVARLK